MSFLRRRLRKQKSDQRGNVKVISNTKREQLVSFAPLLLWIVIILILGSGPGAASQTSRFIGPLIEFFFAGASPETVLLLHGLIRKSAHVIEYGILAALASRAMLASGVEPVRRRWIALSFATVLVVASIDEFNQSLDPSRTGSVWDMVLDSVAGSVTLAIIWAVRKWQADWA